MASSPTIAGLLRLAALLKSAPDLSEVSVSRVSRPRPEDFILDVLGAEPTAAALLHGYTRPWTPDQGRLMAAVCDHQHVAAPAGHGVGKTRAAAWLTLWYLYFHLQCIVVTTAPTARQVEEVLWAEIARIHKSSRTPLPGRQLFTKLEIERGWFALGFSTTGGSVGDMTATSFQGLHAPGGVFVVLDEATAVDPDIWLGAESLGLGPKDRLLVIGNPTDPTSRFRHVCESGRWHVVPMSCLDHPNVIHDDPAIIPGAVTKMWVEERKESYGQESPIYQATVLGQWPEQSEDALIPYGWVTAAQKRRLEKLSAISMPGYKDDGKGAALGLDVAGEGGDLTVLSLVRHGIWELPLVNGRRSWHVGRDVMQAVKLVQDAILQYPDIRTVVLDDTGLGSGVSARLRELQREGKIPKYVVQTADPLEARERSVWILPRNFGASADDDRFRDQKDELWWSVREALRNGDLHLPDEKAMSTWLLPKGNDLEQQLTCPIYCQVNGKTEVYDKRSSRGGGNNEAVRVRIRQLPAKSPDLAHSLLLAWDGYKRLRPMRVFEPARTTMELVARQTQAILDRARKRGKRGFDRREPWQRVLR